LGLPFAPPTLPVRHLPTPDFELMIFLVLGVFWEYLGPLPIKFLVSLFFLVQTSQPFHASKSRTSSPLVWFKMVYVRSESSLSHPSTSLSETFLIILSHLPPPPLSAPADLCLLQQNCSPPFFAQKLCIRVPRSDLQPVQRCSLLTFRFPS